MSEVCEGHSVEERADETKDTGPWRVDRIDGEQEPGHREECQVREPELSRRETLAIPLQRVSGGVQGWRKDRGDADNNVQRGPAVIRFRRGYWCHGHSVRRDWRIASALRESPGRTRQRVSSGSGGRQMGGQVLQERADEVGYVLLQDMTTRTSQ